MCLAIGVGLQAAHYCNCAVVVVSPLIALMEDQVCGLKKKGVKASIMTSSRAVRKEEQCESH